VRLGLGTPRAGVGQGFGSDSTHCSPRTSAGIR
jgi:hypothetical protein